MDLVTGFTEQPFRFLDAQLVQFLPGSSSEDFEERLVQAARRFLEAASSFASSPFTPQEWGYAINI